MKSRILLFSLFFLILLVLPTPNQAQGCQGVMSPSYSTYTSLSLDSSLHIYTTVVVDGSTVIHQSEYCNIGGATHKGSVYNKLGSTGGWVYGPPVPPAQYFAVTNPQEIIGVPGVVYTDTTQADVLCSFVGGLFNSGPGNSLIKIGIANYILESWDSTNCTYMLYCPNGNTAASCPTATVVDYGGMQAEIPCNQLNYHWVYTLVFNGKCFPISVGVGTTVAHICQ
jgi:hypothetical protein